MVTRMPEAGSPVPASVEGDRARPPACGNPGADAAASALCLFAALVSAADPPALWRTLASETARLFDVDRASLYLADADSGDLSGDEIGCPPGALRAFPSRETARQALAAGRLVRGRNQSMAVPIIAEGVPVAALELSGRPGRPFTGAEAHRLAALGVATGLALKTVHSSADLLTLKGYCDAVVQAASDAIIGLDACGRIVGCNAAGLRMLRRRAADVLGKPGRRIFRGDNAWVVEKARRVAATGLAEVAMDAMLRFGRCSLDVNATILPVADRRTGTTAAIAVLDEVSGQKQARETLSRYLDPRLAGRMLLGEARAPARAIRATLLFCDLRNSTGLAGKLGAHQTLALLNEHFALMEECLRAQGGMIDKFIGDALLATFGVLHGGPDDEDRAVRAALAMTAALCRWNESRAASGLIQVEMGIGINTDVVVAGNVGSSRRMDYTVVGTGVSVAARLEKACKTSGAAILATANTVRRLKGRYAIRPADGLAIPGRAAPIEVFEIIGHLDAQAIAGLQRLLVVFRHAFACKSQGRLADAIAGFSECLSLNPYDRAAASQLDACRAAMTKSAG